MIELKNVTFGYKKKENVLTNVSFKIKKGECWGILGHNGAGKTTLSYLIINLLSPKSGEIKNNSRNSDYLSEFGGFYSNLTVLQNFQFKKSLDKNHLDENIDSVIKKIGLSKYKNELASRLSQGLKKRLAIGLIIISDRDLIYLDEPTNGLDPEIQKFLKNYLLELRKKGKTILINSHDINFISDVSTNILILNHGEVVYNDQTNKSYIEEIYFEKVGVYSE